MKSSYTKEFKAEVLKYYDEHGLTKTTLKYKIHPSTLYGWIRIKAGKQTSWAKSKAKLKAEVKPRMITLKPPPPDDEIIVIAKHAKIIIRGRSVEVQNAE